MLSRAKGKEERASRFPRYRVVPLHERPCTSVSTSSSVEVFVPRSLLSPALPPPPPSSLQDFTAIYANRNSQRGRKPHSATDIDTARRKGRLRIANTCEGYLRCAAMRAGLSSSGSAPGGDMHAKTCLIAFSRPPTAMRRHTNPALSTTVAPRRAAHPVEPAALATSLLVPAALVLDRPATLRDRSAVSDSAFSCLPRWSVAPGDLQATP
jgi:hypothetical protein